MIRQAVFVLALLLFAAGPSLSVRAQTPAPPASAADEAARREETYKLLGSKLQQADKDAAAGRLADAYEAGNWNAVVAALAELPGDTRLCGAEVNSIASLIKHGYAPTDAGIFFFHSDTDDGRQIAHRLVHGAVVDFLHFHYAGWSWPAFNLADSAITVGVAMMLWGQFFGPKAGDPPRPGAPS